MTDETGPGKKTIPPEPTADEARDMLRAGLESAPPEEAVLDPALAPEAIAADFPQLEILEIIGRGGMGVVYKARQPSLDRIVALKVLSGRFSADPQFVERFTREARALARLSHPNIVALYDFGQSNGRFYFIMEYVDGSNLRQVLQAGKVSPAEALTIVPKLCDALQYAHEEGVIHRDIKPENVLLDRRGRVKITDFGLAKLLGTMKPGHTLTETGMVMGTPHYMAPEQIERPQQVDHRADVYALGVVFYEMLTGELPLGRFQPPSRKVHIDVRLDDVVLRTLEHEPERRYQQVSEVRTEIEGIAASPGEARVSGTSPTAVLPGQNASAPAPRLDFMALAAAVITVVVPVVLSGVTVVASVFVAANVEMPRPIGQLLRMLWGFLIGALAGTPILGAMAAVRIRQANGALRGLGFALFALLWMPAVGLCALLVAGWGRLMPQGDANWPLGIGIALLIVQYLAYLLRRYFTRPYAAGAARKPGRQTTLTGILVKVGVAAALIAVALVFLMRASDTLRSIVTSPQLLDRAMGTARTLPARRPAADDGRPMHNMPYLVEDPEGRPLQPAPNGNYGWTSGPPVVVGAYREEEYETSGTKVLFRIEYLGNRDGGDAYRVFYTINKDMPDWISHSADVIYKGEPIVVTDKAKRLRVVLGPQFEQGTPPGPQAATPDNVDVSIDRLELQPYPHGGLFQLVVTVKNNAATTSPEFPVVFYKGDPDKGGVAIDKSAYSSPPIAPGATMGEVCAPFAVPDGLHEFVVELYPWHRVIPAGRGPIRARIRAEIKDGKIVTSGALVAAEARAS